MKGLPEIRDYKRRQCRTFMATQKKKEPNKVRRFRLSDETTEMLNAGKPRGMSWDLFFKSLAEGRNNETK